MAPVPENLRNLVIVFGDQLDPKGAALENFDEERDLVWMAEAEGEATQVWSNKNRIAYFLAAMRHFREALEKRGMPVHYRELAPERESLPELLAGDLKRMQPDKVVCTHPGEWQVLEDLRRTCREPGIALEIREDSHFLDTLDGFREWAGGRKELRLEYYYRELRKRHGILMTEDGGPEGGRWNFDKENRESFDKSGQGPDVPAVPAFSPDRITREVLELVGKRFAKHPGSLEHFNWPVSREQARQALDDFMENRLQRFGRYQDAMWTGEPFLFHSLLSAALNVKLLDPREVLEAAVRSYRKGKAPLPAVEGFVRQILGWREYVRGLYWWKMPGYLRMNALSADEELPEFYWNGETPLRCLGEALQQTLRFGYAHHIQRLMVTGLYGLLLGIQPRRMHEWYLAVYVDAVEWVELPNTIGMSQFADGGLMATKPYAASGKYIQRMSNYCAGCPANPAQASGDRACPFTTLYWDFLLRHRDRLKDNRRMALQLKNVERLSAGERKAICERAKEVRRDPSCAKLFT